MTRTAALSVILSLALVACADAPGSKPSEGAAKVDSVCQRDCKTTYSQCVQRAAAAQEKQRATDMVRTCESAQKQCTDGCPPARY